MENPFTEEKKEAMQECISSTVQGFITSYTLSFGAALVDDLREGGSKKRSSMSMPSGLRLVSAPDPSEIVCEGFLEKKGAWMRNWKKRWFMCYNKDKNFVISYYTSQTNLKKAKGEILLDGYTVTTDLTEDEKKECGEFGLKMTCGEHSKRRTWFIRGTSQEDVEKFLPAVKNACKKARPAFKIGDKVEGAAFQAAYADTRFDKGLSPSLPGGSEEECFGGLVAEIVNVEVMGEVFDGFPEGLQGRTMKNVAEKAMFAAIGAAVGAAWSATKGVAKSGRPAMESGIKATLKPIQEAEQMLYGKIGEATSTITDPAVETMKETRISPLVEKVVGPVSDAFQVAIQVWTEIAKDVVAQTNGNADDLDAACNAGYKKYWTSSKIEESCSMLDATLYGMEEILGDFPADDLVLQLRDSMHHLISRGISTLQANIKTGSTPDEAYALTRGFVVHDANLMFSDLRKEQGIG
jgi:hypothetical protein